MQASTPTRRRGLATAYTFCLLYAAGLQFLLPSCLLYAPGTWLSIRSRRQQGRQVFSDPERSLFILISVGAVIGVIGLVGGWITI